MRSPLRHCQAQADPMAPRLPAPRVPASGQSTCLRPLTGACPPRPPPLQIHLCVPAALNGTCIRGPQSPCSAAPAPAGPPLRRRGRRAGPCWGQVPPQQPHRLHPDHQEPPRARLHCITWPFPAPSTVRQRPSCRKPHSPPTPTPALPQLCVLGGPAGPGPGDISELTAQSCARQAHREASFPVTFRISLACPVVTPFKRPPFCHFPHAITRCTPPPWCSWGAGRKAPSPCPTPLWGWLQVCVDNHAVQTGCWFNSLVRTPGAAIFPE